MGVPVDPEVYITIAVSCGVGDMIASWPVGLDDRILAPYDGKIKKFKIHYRHFRKNLFRQDQYDSASKFIVTSVTTDLNGSVSMSISMGFIESLEAEKLSSKKMICFTYNS